MIFNTQEELDAAALEAIERGEVFGTEGEPIDLRFDATLYIIAAGHTVPVECVTAFRSYHPDVANVRVKREIDNIRLVPMAAPNALDSYMLGEDDD